MPIAALGMLKITFPSNVVPASSLTCSISTPVSSTLACTLSGLVVTVTMPSSTINANQIFTISVNNVRNPASLQLYGTFSFSTLTPNGLDNYCT